MDNSYQQIIGSLRGVPKVQGSFLSSDSGVILANDMPRFLSASLLQVVSVKLLALNAAMGDGTDAFRQVEVQYRDYTLLGQRIRGGILCVLADTEVLAKELGMALAAVGHQLDVLRG
jgi:hypothetical protein